MYIHGVYWRSYEDSAGPGKLEPVPYKVPLAKVLLPNPILLNPVVGYGRCAQPGPRNRLMGRPTNGDWTSHRIRLSRHSTLDTLI